MVATMLPSTIATVSKIMDFVMDFILEERQSLSSFQIVHATNTAEPGNVKFHTVANVTTDGLYEFETTIGALTLRCLTSGDPT